MGGLGLEPNGLERKRRVAAVHAHLREELLHVHSERRLRLQLITEQRQIIVPVVERERVLRHAPYMVPRPPTAEPPGYCGVISRNETPSSSSGTTVQRWSISGTRLGVNSGTH